MKNRGEAEVRDHVRPPKLVPLSARIFRPPGGGLPVDFKNKLRAVAGHVLLRKVGPIVVMANGDHQVSGGAAPAAAGKSSSKTPWIRVGARKFGLSCTR